MVVVRTPKAVENRTTPFLYWVEQSNLLYGKWGKWYAVSGIARNLARARNTVAHFRSQGHATGQRFRLVRARIQEQKVIS